MSTTPAIETDQPCSVGASESSESVGPVAHSDGQICGSGIIGTGAAKASVSDREVGQADRERFEDWLAKYPAAGGPNSQSEGAVPRPQDARLRNLAGGLRIDPKGSPVQADSFEWGTWMCAPSLRRLKNPSPFSSLQISLIICATTVPLAYILFFGTSAPTIDFDAARTTASFNASSAAPEPLGLRSARTPADAPAAANGTKEAPALSMEDGRRPNGRRIEGTVATLQPASESKGRPGGSRATEGASGAMENQDADRKALRPHEAQETSTSRLDIAVAAVEPQMAALPAKSALLSPESSMPTGAQTVAAGIEAEPMGQTPSKSKQSARHSGSGLSMTEVTLSDVQPAPNLTSMKIESNAIADKRKPVMDMLAALNEAPVRRDANTMASAQDTQLLIERGRRLLEAGDVIAARLLFNRAAKAGDAAAAVAMGTTYDPAMLRGHGLSGSPGDSEKARSWYELADKLGSPEKPPPSELHIAPARAEEFGRRDYSPSPVAPTQRLIHSSSGAKH